MPIRLSSPSSAHVKEQLGAPYPNREKAAAHRITRFAINYKPSTINL